MGDSTEEMLNVTIKRLEAIMVHFTPEEALEAEAHNLIDAAIVILKSSREDMDAGKAVAYWEQLRGYAKTLYIESVTMRYTKPRAGEFAGNGQAISRTGEEASQQMRSILRILRQH